MKPTAALMSLGLLTLTFLSMAFAVPVEVAGAAADEIEKCHVFYMNCGWEQTYCNSQYYYCDRVGLLSYIFDINTICNVYCERYSLSDPPTQPNPPPVPLFPTSTSVALVATFGITFVAAVNIWPPIPTVSPCFGDVWGWDCNKQAVPTILSTVASTDAVIGTTPPMDKEAKPVQPVRMATSSPESLDKRHKPTQRLQIGATSSKSLSLEVMPTDSDLEVTSASTPDIDVDTLSKRHNYAMAFGQQQNYCSRSG